MADRSDQARSIFLEAIESHAPEQWPGFLDQACGGDAVLRERIERLLRAQVQLGSYREDVQAARVALLEQSEVTEGPGTIIGPYRLKEQIGEGGMGLVFVADQRQPIRRRVAIKVIKPGMDSKQVIARFDIERQALAMMDHPNIAHVLDAGTTESGRPYFVMELVKGVPITEYCDRKRLTTRERLELFLSVCQAVQHAHQKGIIHRDLKPSNVLVTVHDVTPVVKIIDFGIAKAMGEHLTGHSVYTGFSQLMGTPLYMSPEQAGMSSLDVDTRSDIYSLGVLLYELITGTTPVDAETLKKADFDQLRRIIREEEPPRPSTRISTLGLAATTASANRQSDPRKLCRQIRGELDWIVMKALEKDRNRRYQTANSLAADLRRYLADEPVQARPPSTGYRLHKFVRRNRGLVLAVVVVLIALVAGIIGTTWGLVHADRARRDAVAAQIAEGERAAGERRAREAETAERLRAEGNAGLATAVLDEIVLQEARQRLTLYRAELARGQAKSPDREKLEHDFLQKGLKFYEQLARTNATDWAARRKRARAYANVGLLRLDLKSYAESEKAYLQAIQLMQELEAERPKDFDNRFDLGDAYRWSYRPFYDSGRLRPAEEHTRHALNLFESLAADFPDRRALMQENEAYCLRNLAGLLQRAGRAEEAERAYRQSVAIWTELAAANQYPGYRHALAYDHGRLGDLFQQLGQTSKAVDAWRQSVSILNQVVAETNGPLSRWQLAGWHERLALCFQGTDRFEEAEKEFRIALQIWEKLAAETQEPDHRWHLARCHEYMGHFYRQTGRVQEAVKAFQAGLPIWEKLVAEWPNVADYRGHLTGNYGVLTELLLDLEDHAEAARIAERLPSALLDAGQGNNQAARVLARCAPLAEKDTKLSPADRKVLARTYAERSRDLMQDAVRTAPDPNAPELLDELARTHHVVAQSLQTSGRVNEAEKEIRQASEIWEKLAKDWSDRPQYRKSLAWTQRRHAEMLADVKRSKEAEETYRKAEATFEKLVADFPDDCSCRGDLADLDWNLGNFLNDVGKPKEAEQCYRHALAAFEKLADDEPDKSFWRQEQSYVLWLLGMLLRDTDRAQESDAAFSKSVAVLDGLVDEFPASVAYRSRRGTVHAELRQWREAAADFAKIIELTPTPLQNWCYSALAYLGNGDTNGYREICARVLERFGKTDDPVAAYWVAWSCVFAPDAVADPDQLVRIAEKASAAADYDSLNTLGAALYRAGRYPDAIKRLEEAARVYPSVAHSRQPIVYNWFFLAMAHHRLGQADEAKTWLQKAVEWIDQVSQEKGKDGEGNVPMPWNRRLTLQLLRREAETMIRGSAPKK